jgi:hypothetical protein
MTYLYDSAVRPNHMNGGYIGCCWLTLCSTEDADTQCQILVNMFLSLIAHPEYFDISDLDFYFWYHISVQIKTKTHKKSNLSCVYLRQRFVSPAISGVHGEKESDDKVYYKGKLYLGAPKPEN